MKLVLLVGPQAVGKMTVGEELAATTGLKLFHNHMTIELVSNFFSYGTETGNRLVTLFRHEIFEAVADSDLKGLIFTYLCAFDLAGDMEYLKNLSDIFMRRGADIYFVELEADLEERLKRNKTPHRLEEKPSKRDIEWSENNLLSSAQKYRLNSYPGEVEYENYMRINNTGLSAREVADMIVENFGL